MNIASITLARPSPAQQADAAMQAITAQAKAENLSRVAELSGDIGEGHVAEHIRGMVAATMGHLSADASTSTRNNAVHWQEWALGVADGVADGVAQTVPAAV
jgi:hypothetical protein